MIEEILQHLGTLKYTIPGTVGIEVMQDALQGLGYRVMIGFCGLHRNDLVSKTSKHQTEATRVLSV